MIAEGLAAQVEIRQRRLAIGVLEHEAHVAAMPGPFVQPTHGILSCASVRSAFDQLLAAALGVDASP